MCRSIIFTHFQNIKKDQSAVGPLEVPSPKKADAHTSLPEVKVAEKASLFDLEVFDS